MAKVSIIVPAYNSEKTIENCLRNLVNQTLEDIEIILVNDCSKDKTYDYMLAYEHYFPDKIILVNLPENLGVGGARNVGLSYASGEYIGFVDSDDMVDISMFEKLYGKAGEGDYDIVDCAYYDEEKQKAVLCTGRQYEGQLDDNKRSELIGIGGYLFSRIYKRNLWEGVKFREHTILEDCETLIQVLTRAKSIGVVEEALYVYKATSTSLTRTQSPEKYHKAVIETMDAIYSLNCKEAVLRAIEYFYAHLALFGLSNIKNLDNNLSFERRNEMRREIGERLNNYCKCRIKENEICQLKMSANEIGEIEELMGKNKKSNTGKVSVIIPCYNVEQWIDRCLESIVNQTVGLQRLEIICVDDCSTDGTFEKLTGWENKYTDNFIIVKSPQNGRQGQARNIGLEYASGDWIGFVDSDDWVEPEYFDEMLKASCRGNFEIVCCGSERDVSREYTFFDKESENKVTEYIVESDDKRKEIIVHPPLEYSAWGKIIKKDFIISNNLLFPTNITYEDAAWGSLVHLYVNKACVLEKKMYHYFVNEDSTVLKRGSNHHLDCITAQTYVWREYRLRGFLDKYKDELQMEHIFSGYLPALKACILRYEVPDYNYYLLLRELMRDRLEGYKDNPYVGKGYLSDYYLMLLSAVDNKLNKSQFIELAEYIKKIGL